MRDKGARTGLSFGFGLAGLMAAGLAYWAAEYGLFSGPAWRSVLVAIAIGGGSAFVMLGADRLIQASREPKPDRPIKMRGPWGCPQCGAAYVAAATECSDCHVPLTGDRSRADEAKR